MQTHPASLGFTNLYNINPDFTLKAKIINAIVFVPLNRINEYVDSQVTELPEKLHDLLNWSEDACVGRPNR